MSAFCKNVNGRSKQSTQWRSFVAAFAPLSLMSASWSSSQDRQRRARAYRRLRRSAVPVEIDAQATPPRSPTSHHQTRESNTGKQHADTKQTRNSDETLWKPKEKSIEILPGSLLMPHGEPWLHPPEPTHAPPMPTEIIQFLILGEYNAGKSTLVRRFRQTHCTHSITNNKTCHKRKQSREWSVEYHKKDVTFWLDETTVGCARIQLWDVTGGGPSDEPLERRQEWLRLLQKMSGIVLVISLEQGPNALFDKILSWKHWLDECCAASSHAPTVYLFLQKCDLLPCQAVQPMIWMELGSRISKLCIEIGICDWHMTTCAAKSADQSPEEAFMKLAQCLVTTTVPPQKKVSFESSPTRSVSLRGRQGQSTTKKLT